MPNWAYNKVKLTHKDSAMIDRMVAAFKKGAIMQEFHPCPAALMETVSGFHGDPEKQKQLEQQQKENIANYGHKDWYSWCVAEWGTKWDFGGAEDSEVEIVHEAVGQDLLPTIDIYFETAWSPPIEAYKKLEEQGFIIHAMYDEESTAFCGEYVTDQGENTIQMQFDSEWARHHVPKHINDAFGIVERIEQYENEEDDYEEEEEEPRRLRNKDE